MRYHYYTADVFTDRRFGGNQLAVLPDARGLSTEQMLAVTREFNYSESTFVLPPAHEGETCRVRIFTPGGEVPFAGHPTVGTAHVLTAIGQVPLTGAETRLVLGEEVGPVPVLVRAEDGVPTFAQLSVAQLPTETAPAADPAAIAEVLSLAPGDLLGGDYAPRVASCGLPFLLVPVRDREAVRRARVRLDVWEGALRGTTGSEVMVFALDAAGPRADVRARVFVPGLSVPEDPATGSACAALAGYLAARTPRDGTVRWVVEQGVEMGRPSRLELEADKAGGAVTGVRVGGRSVLVCEGTIEIGD
ncbi:MAG TPA: PhzF family phenazine biosynthesis protein [Gemmatimonadaceae bacterium]|nr:PhzF family phenazine biosynthesis protein [Gemmatimonadaceae bacterium]